MIEITARRAAAALVAEGISSEIAVAAISRRIELGADEVLTGHQFEVAQFDARIAQSRGFWQ